MHVFDSDAVDMPLRPMVNRFGGCFCLGSGPVFLGFVVFSAVCFAVSAGETQVWLGDLRVVVFCLVVVFGFVASIDLPTPRRAISATSATLEEKKTERGHATKGSKNTRPRTKEGRKARPKSKPHQTNCKIVSKEVVVVTVPGAPQWEGGQ